ncbi:hypothetical protein T09_13726, partial [Trichinella sp. T9]
LFGSFLSLCDCLCLCYTECFLCLIVCGLLLFFVYKMCRP